MIKRLAEQKQTMVIVTHEMQFAKAISDKVVFIDEGRVQEEGSAEDIFENSRSERLKSFLEVINLDNL